MLVQTSWSGVNHHRSLPSAFCTHFSPQALDTWISCAMDWITHWEKNHGFVFFKSWRGSNNSYQGTELVIVLVYNGIFPNFLIDTHEDHSIILRSNNISGEWNRFRSGCPIVLSMRLIVLPIKLNVGKDHSNTGIQTPLCVCVYICLFVCF